MAPVDGESPTELLLAWGRGEETALERLMPLVHGELHRLARRYMARERPEHTLQPTALVNCSMLISYSRCTATDRS